MSKTTNGAPLISFAGIDGSGKSTQTAALTAALRRGELDVVHSKTQFSAMRSVFALSEKLYGDAHDYHPSIPATLREFVVACEVAEHFRARIAPQRAEGRWVVWDRGPLCYEAYARAYGADLSWVTAVLDLVERPTVTFLIDIDPDLAWERVQARTDKAVLTSEQPGFLQQVRKEYLALAADRDDIVVLDGTLPADTLAASVLRRVDRLRDAVAIRPAISR